MDQQTSPGPEITYRVKEEQRGNESQTASTVIMCHSSINLQNSQDQILCLCPHEFWLWTLDPILKVLQLKYPSPNGVVRAINFESHCTVSVLVLQMGVNCALPLTGTYQWFYISASVWYVIKEVAHFRNQSLSVFKALQFDPSFVAEEGSWDDIDVSTEVQLIQGAAIDGGHDDFMANVLSHPMVTTCPEPRHDCENGEPLGIRLYRLWLECYGTEVAVSSPTCIAPCGSTGGFAVKEEVEEEEHSVSQCKETEHERTVPTETGSQEWISVSDVKLEFTGENENILLQSLCGPVPPVSHKTGSTPLISSTEGEPGASSRCKMNTDKGFDELFRVCKSYNALFEPRVDPCISPFRKFHFGGPRSMVECPACSMPFKGNASDMLDLCRHIKIHHREAKSILLECVQDTYQDRFQYMEKKIRDHTSKMYRNRLRGYAVHTN